MASGALLARMGLLPYLDYPYFHLPNLVFVYAAIFSTNDFLLLSARSFNIFCAWLLVLLVFAMTASAFRALGEKRWAIATGFALCLALQPLFRFTVGRAWNHDLPMLLSVAALAILLRAMQAERARKWLVASGALLGLAVGTRLTFLPLVLPFLALTWMFSATSAARSRNPLLFFAGFVVALLPTLALFAAGPDAFIFNTITCNGSINLRYQETRKALSETLLNKLLDPIKLLKSPATLLLVVGFIVFAYRYPFRNGWRAALSSIETAAFLLIIPVLLFASSLPAQPYRQYYYAPVPFLLLGVAYGMARVWNAERDYGKIRRLLAIVIPISFLQVLPELPGSNLLAGWERWPVFEMHRTGLDLRAKAGPGPILILAPIYPLEGGATIYPQFCTGPFAWRIAPFVEPEVRARHGLVGADDLDTALVPRPAAIVTNYDNAALGKPLKKYAQRLGYTRLTLSDGEGVLWLPQPLANQ